MEHKNMDFDEGWAVVQNGIKKLKGMLEGQTDQFNAEEYLNLYTAIYNICILDAPHDYSQELYDKYKGVFNEYNESTVFPFIREKHDEFMLRELVKRWSNHKIMVRWLSHFFHYLDRHFVPTTVLPDLREVGLISFRDWVFSAVNSKARDAVIVLIDREREGEQIDRALLKNVLEIFVEIGMGSMMCYEEDFEKHMLLDTSAYYSRNAPNWIMDDSFLDYILKAEECLKKERDRVSNYLHLSTEPKLVEKVQHELLAICPTQLLEKECRAMLRDDKVEHLSRIYRLFHKIPKVLEMVATIFKQHITAEGTVEMQQAEEAENQSASGGAQKQVLVRKIIELHDKYMVYVNDCFQDHTLFHEALKEAFEVLCSKKVSGSSSAELLAIFCDQILTKGESELSDETIEETLKKVVWLLGYNFEKNIFAELYRGKLAYHLILERSTNIEHERYILEKMRQQCGEQFTSEMECMVNDVLPSRKVQANFSSYLEKNPDAHPGIDMSVTALRREFWPSYKSTDLNLPAEMVRAVQVFEEFYYQETLNRKLSWIYSLGSCLINGEFEGKTIELIVSTDQAAILLLYNSWDKLSYSEIMTQTNLAHDDLVRLLHSLSCAKYKILTKEPDTQTVTQTDYFEFNHKFTDTRRRIEIPLAPVDERKVIGDLKEGRCVAIRCAIMRIMKSRRVLDRRDLVSECMEKMSPMFKPEIRSIEREIKHLIAKDYLEEDMEDPKKYRYVP